MASNFVALKLWLKLEAAIPFVIIDGASAYKKFHLAVIACLVIACLNSIAEELVMFRIRMPFFKLAWVLAGSAIIPIGTYLLLLLCLVQTHLFGDPFYSYGMTNVFGFLCGLVIIVRLSTVIIENKMK
jgi:hypothetical protein